MPTDNPITPTCCPAVQSQPSTAAGGALDLLGTISLGWPYGRNDSLPPVWCVAVRTNWGSICTNVEVKFCPHCGKSLPGIRPRRKKPRGRIAVDDGNGYCATCGRRCRECGCLPPQWNWEADE